MASAIPSKPKFTQLPLLPTHPGFDLASYTPWEWRRQCWLLSPPLCPECGFWFTRPQSYVKKPGSRSADKEFCSNACAKRWRDRLSQVWIPYHYKNIEWPGRATGALPEEVQRIRELWNRDADKVKYGRTPGIDICGAMCHGYPTNDFPLRRDTRGKECHRPAGVGTDHYGIGPCSAHVGTAPGVANHHIKQKAVRDMTEQQFIFGQPINITPEEAIMQELHRTAGIVNWLEGKLNQQSDNAQSDDGITAYHPKTGVKQSVWMDMYQNERDRLAQVAKTAASMGIAQRQIQIVEEQGRMLAAVITKLLNHPTLELTPKQRVHAPDIIRQLLMELPSSTGTPIDTGVRARVVDDNGLTVATNDYLASLEDDPQDAEIIGLDPEEDDE